MTLRLAKKLQTILTIALILLLVVFVFLRMIPVFFLIGVVVVALAAVKRFFLRCPHCGKSLSRGHVAYCTYCGKWVDPETTF